MSSEPENARDQSRALEAKAAAIREDVDVLLAEADRRRRKLLGGRGKPSVFIIAGAGLATLAGVAVSLILVKRYERRHSIEGRIIAFSKAFRRVLKRPERVAKVEPNLGLKVLASAASALAATFAKRGASRLLASRSLAQRSA
jgi:hypothetical protein